MNEKKVFAGIMLAAAVFSATNALWSLSYLDCEAKCSEAVRKRLITDYSACCRGCRGGS